MDFDLENPLTDSDEFVSDSDSPLFLVESDHMPSEKYFSSLQTGDFDFLVRREAISSISQFSCDFDPQLPYLAVNYLDRFLSCHGMPLNKKWVIKLIAISCVSLAAKMMKKTEMYLNLTDFRGDGGIIFDNQTIARMECLILGALKWRMRSITPLSFIPFFISLFKFQYSPLCQALKTRAIHIIFKAQNDINFLEYKPSIISATALLSASHELFPLQYHGFRKSLSNFSHLNKEDMSQCFRAFQALMLEEYEPPLCDVSSSLTPANVLDQGFSSSDTGFNNNNNNNIKSNSTIPGDEMDAKRRKISDHHYS